MSDLEGASLYADVLRYQKKAATLASAFLPKGMQTSSVLPSCCATYNDASI